MMCEVNDANCEVNDAKCVVIYAPLSSQIRMNTSEEAGRKVLY